MDSLKGKVAIVTGAARGIGAETALALAAEGAEVFVTDLLEEAGTDTVDRIVSAGGRATFVKHDVASEDSWKGLFAKLHARAPHVDVLVNNAGIHRYSKLEETTVEMFGLLISVNLKGVMLGTKYAVQSMKNRPKCADSASIVNISSTVGIVGSPFSSIYSMTKAGVRLFTKSTALEVAEQGYNIRCNSVHPGVVEPEMANAAGTRLEEAGAAHEAVTGSLVRLHPLGRLATPKDISNGVVFLASNQSAFMTGTELIIDDGWMAR